jgi:putative peptidyl-prolyl cis-trans isomerase
MKKSFFVFLIGMIPALLFGASGSAEKPVVIDYVAAIINGKPITDSEVVTRFELMKKSKKQIKGMDKSRVLDQLIDEQIIEQVAESESIQVTDARIDNEIADMMKRMNISDKTQFIKKLESEQGISYAVLRLQLRQQNLAEQVMTYAVTFSPPSKAEVREWYEKNKSRPDFIQMNMKHILIRPRSGSFEDEKAANERIKAIYQKALNGASFEELAKKESQDPGSAANGGDLSWVYLADLDPYFATVAMQSYRPGKLSTVFKSTFGYHFIKFIGKRVVSFEEVEPRISNMLSSQRRSDQFVKWLSDKKKVSEISIYMEGYIKVKGTNEKGSGSSRK